MGSNPTLSATSPSSKTTRALVLFGGVLAAAGFLVAVAAALTNLPAFDEPLVADLGALKIARPPNLNQNAYTLAFGFLAANDRDPRVAGEAIVKSLHDRHEANQRISLAPEELRELLGARGGREEWQPHFRSLECVPRVDLDCADRLIGEVAARGIEDSRFAVLLQRFEVMEQQARFDEGQERDAYTNVAPYGAISDVARIRLAVSFKRDTVAEFLAKTGGAMRLWKIMLREGETLVTKMVAVAGIQHTLDFISALLRDRELTEAELRTLQSILVPLTPHELDIGNAFLSEAQIAVLTGRSPVEMNASFLDRLTLQGNATLNEVYLQTIRPMRARSRLGSVEYYRQGAYLPLHYPRSGFPPSLFNWGGRRLARNSGWDPEQFLSRVHDLNGRTVLVLIQAELERSASPDVAATLASRSYLNPYTNEPMEYDARLNVVGFRCLHTAYHPPAAPNRCAVRIR